MGKANRDLKYSLYEYAVQSPEVHVEWISRFHLEATGVVANKLREDFCGTFALSTAWIKSNESRMALGIDLDPEPLLFGKKKRLNQLKLSEKKRLLICEGNVLTPPRFFKPDTIAACNFSFCIFREREVLKEYFKSCFKTLNSPGTLILELAGGPGMIEQSKETKSIYRGKKKAYTYVWDQKSFDPIHRHGTYAIHFRLKDKKRTWLKDAFVYEWRLWTIPELRDLLREVGFSTTTVYWETEHEGKATGEYLAMEKGDNAFAWVTYLVAQKLRQ